MTALHRALLYLLLVLPGLVLAAPKISTSLPPKTKLFRIVVEDFWQTNCYIIVSPSGKAIIIDPGDTLETVGRELYRTTGKDARRIYDFLVQNKYELKYILLTHGHLDHLGAVKFLKEKTGAQIMMHAADVRQAGDPLAGQPKDANLIEGGLVKVDRTLADGEVITFDGMSLKVIYTPGHGRGSVCFLTTFNGKPILFSGDTLLHYYKGYTGEYYDTGRTNFKDGTGDQDQLYRMIREKLFILPDETLVYPGHYDYTTIGLEKQYSPAMITPERPVDIPKEEE